MSRPVNDNSRLILIEKLHNIPWFLARYSLHMNFYIVYFTDFIAWFLVTAISACAGNCG